MVEVRQTLMTIVEVPLVQNVEIVRHVPKPQTQKFPKQVARPVVRCVSEHGEMPQVTFRDDICPKGTVIAFHWDDTVCLPSALKDSGIAPRGPPLLSNALAAMNVLMAALQYSTKVVVVTNAGEGWVQISRSGWMPALFPTLGFREIVSARAECEAPGFTSKQDEGHCLFIWISMCCSSKAVCRVNEASESSNTSNTFHRCTHGRFSFGVSRGFVFPFLARVFFHRSPSNHDLHVEQCRDQHVLLFGWEDPRLRSEPKS